MNDTELMVTVRLRAQTDEWYQQCLSFVELYEPAFHAIRDALPEQQQFQLDDYLAACENLEQALCFISYQVGREQGGLAAGSPGNQS